MVFPKKSDVQEQRTCLQPSVLSSLFHHLIDFFGRQYNRKARSSPKIMSSERKSTPYRSRETKASSPPPSKTRPGHLSNLPKSTAVIESPGPSPDFPGAFPREKLPRNPFQSSSNTHRRTTTQLGQPSTLLREASQISNSTASFYSATSRQSVTFPTELGNEDKNVFSSKNRVENESKRGRDALEGKEKEDIIPGRKKMRKNDGGGESLDLQSSETQLAAKEYEVVRMKLTEKYVKHSYTLYARLNLERS